MRIHFDLPAGWPWSIWFFIAALVVYLLQRFPVTGIFLMFVLAMFWSIFLINAGMIGITVEALTGRVNPVWLAIPALYFGGYYAAYFADQAAFARLKASTARFNAGKRLAFDPDRQDLVVVPNNNGLGLQGGAFIERFGLPRVFSDEGRVRLIGTKDVCQLINGDRAFLSAGIQGNFITKAGARRYQRVSTNFCLVTMPGVPDRPVVELAEIPDRKTRGLLQVSLATLTLTDKANGKSVEVRAGRAMPLRKFPMPVMGCALNSGAPSWDCFHGFMREDPKPVVAGAVPYSSGIEVAAQALGLKRSDDLSRHAVGIERFQPIADRIKFEMVTKEVAILERMLGNPTEYVRDGWLWHLPDRPEVVAPFAPRIFDALETLQQSLGNGGDTAKNLWRLVAAMSEATVAPFRPRMAALMRKDAARPWTVDSWAAYKQLDATDKAQRDILLDRLSADGGVIGELLPPFCRMGASAPPDVKQRLLALWKTTTPAAGGNYPGRHNHGDLILYLTLARMGLKAQAGQVEQRYMGGDYRDIWAHITPASPEAVCVGSTNDLSNYFRTNFGRP